MVEADAALDVGVVSGQNDPLRLLGEVVTIFSRHPQLKHMPLASLEWSVAPALALGQFMLLRGTLRSKDAGPAPDTLPVGVALWASVSDDVNARLAAQRATGLPYQLAPGEWRSGPHRWLLAVVAPEQMRRALAAQAARRIGDAGALAFHTLAQVEAVEQPPVAEAVG